MKILRTLIAAALLVSATASQAIDLLVRNATSCPAIVTALVNQQLVTRTTDPVTSAVTDIPAPGVDYVPWAGTGKLMTAKPVIDAQGNVITPPTFLAGCVMLVRLSGPMAASDAITPDPADPNKAEQWARSKLAQKVKNTGSPGTFSLGGCTVNYVAIGAFQVVRYKELGDCMDSLGLPKHEWAGGNSP